MQPVHPRRVSVRNAWWAVLAALVCMVVYILGCVLSKPAWSPNSSQVALLVTPPGDDPNLSAVFLYDVKAGTHRLLDQVPAHGVLSGPAWSPDGRWIAYYRVEPSPGPNVPDQTSHGPDQGVANAVLPGLLLNMLKEGQEDEATRRDIKVMAISPDGKERKVLCTAAWAGSRDDLRTLMAMGPTWSKDSRHLFYAPPLGQAFPVMDLDVVTGRSQALLVSSTGEAVPSPDGRWVATLLSDESKRTALVLASADGRMQKYVRLDLELEDEADLLVLSELSWFPDSRRVLVSAGQSMLVVNADTGEGRAYRDPDTDEIAYGVPSPAGDTVFYLCGLKRGEPSSGDEDIELRSLTLRNGRTKRILRLSEGMGLKSLGRFSVSPNGKLILFRGITQDPAGREKTVLILWDGKRTKTIDTDPWLAELRGSR